MRQYTMNNYTLGHFALNFLTINSKTIKCAPKYNMIEEIIEKIAPIARKHQTWATTLTLSHNPELFF